MYRRQPIIKSGPQKLSGHCYSMLTSLKRNVFVCRGDYMEYDAQVHSYEVAVSLLTCVK